jgi:hypothetical protein
MAASLPSLAFPAATPRTMEISRIFWEKATAIHVYCLQGKDRLASRFSRHLHDLARLQQLGHATAAIAARNVAQTVAAHKSQFFKMKGADGNAIDYVASVQGGLMLIPTGEDLDALRADYETMRDEGLLSAAASPFEQILEQCLELQTEANHIGELESA